MDGIQMATGHFVDGHVVPGALDVTIRHNTIYAIDPNGEFGTSAIISGHGSDVNILIEKNLLAGGAFTLYCEQDAKGTNYRVAQQPLQPHVRLEGGLLRPVNRVLGRKRVGQRLPRDGEAPEPGVRVAPRTGKRGPGGSRRDPRRDVLRPPRRGSPSTCRIRCSRNRTKHEGRGDH